MERYAKNSSRTRVCPAFSAICAARKLREFFEFINEGQGRYAISLDGVLWSNVDVRFANEEGKGEKALRPSRDLLYWMVLNAGRDQRIKCNCSDCSDNTGRERRALFQRDSATRELALEKLSQGCVGGKNSWPVLEGYSKPDVFIATNKFICVIEGKRTEGHATEKTSFFDERDQLLRHMDAAIEIADDRPVYGVTIYEDGLDFQSGKFTMRTLPHRSKTIQEKLRRGYLKAKTWQQLQDYFYRLYGLNLGYIKELRSGRRILEPYPPSNLES